MKIKTMENVMKKDILIQAILNDEVSIYACNITRMAEEARVIHSLMPVGTIILGRVLAAATMMSAMLKNDKDKITIMINGGRQAGTIMAVGNADLKIKGYIANPGVNPPPSEQGGFDIKAAVGNDGFITVVRDTGLKEPYIGKVKLVSGEIAEDIANYFLVSEQQPSIVYVNTWLETDMSVLNCGGIIIRPLPGCSEETLKQVEDRVGQIANFALMSFQTSVEEVLKKIFDGLNLKILNEREPEYLCDCSRERLKEVVVSLGEDEIKDIIEKDHGTQIKCHFCGKEYNFDEKELSELLENAKEK